MPDGRAHEVTLHFDGAGRVTSRHETGADGSVCVTEWVFDASGLPRSVRARLPSGAPCGGEPASVDYTIEVDARGQWVRHDVDVVSASGRRWRAAEHRREIEYR